MGSTDTFARAQARVADILAAYQRPAVQEGAVLEMQKMVEHLAVQAGMDGLPPL